MLAYLKDWLVLSKKEGGEWGINHIPEMYHGLMQDAMREYADGVDITYEINLAKNYAEYMVEQITNVRKKIGVFYDDLLSITKIKLLY